VGRVFSNLYAIGLLAVFALRTRASVVQVETPALIPIGVMHKLLWRSTLILDAREPTTQYSDPRSLQSVFHGLLMRLTRLSAGRFAATVVTSPGHVAQYEALGLVPVVVILNSPDSEREVPAEWADEPPSSRKRVLRFVGTLTPGRYLEELVHAFAAGAAHSDSAALRLTGPCAEDYRRELQSLIDGTGADIEIEEGVPPEAVPQLLRRTDVACVTLDPENRGATELVPNKLLEAMAIGCFIIYFDGAEIRKLVGADGFGYSNRTELEEVIRGTLAKSRSDLEACGASLRDRFASEYSWDAQVTATVVPLVRHAVSSES